MSSSKKQLNWEEAIIPGISLLFALAYFYQTRDASIEVLWWPVAIAALTGILWISIVCYFLFTSRGATSEKRFSFGKPLLILICPLVYILSLPYLGFALGSFLFLNILFRCLGSAVWWRNILVALLITGGLYIVMIELMEMSLPQLELGSFVL